MKSQIVRKRNYKVLATNWLDLLNWRKYKIFISTHEIMRRMVGYLY